MCDVVSLQLQELWLCTQWSGVYFEINMRPSHLEINIMPIHLMYMYMYIHMHVHVFTYMYMYYEPLLVVGCLLPNVWSEWA